VTNVITIIKVHTIYPLSVLVPFDLSFRNGVRVAMELHVPANSFVGIVWSIFNLFERRHRYIHTHTSHVTLYSAGRVDGRS